MSPSIFCDGGDRRRQRPLSLSSIVRQPTGSVMSFDWTDFLPTGASSTSSAYPGGRDEYDDDGGDGDESGAAVATKPASPLSPPSPPCFASPCEDKRTVRSQLPASSSPSPSSLRMTSQLSCSPDSVLDLPTYSAPQPRRAVAIAPRSPSRITFCPTVSLRTHEVIASDHPCCREGLALELGWDHRDATAELRDNQQRRGQRRKVHRRSLAERRHYLLSNTGVTHGELDELLEEHHVRIRSAVQPRPLFSSTHEQRHQKRKEQAKGVTDVSRTVLNLNRSASADNLSSI